MATTQEAFASALQYHQAGQLERAEQLYRQILAQHPDHANALHLLGVAAHQMGRHELAIEHIGQAIRIQAGDAAFHNNLGEAYRALGRTAEAAECYRRALELKPNHVEAHYNLGLALKSEGQLPEAESCYRRALELRPNYVQAHNNLGIACKEQGRLDEAIACYRRALELDPAYAEAHYNLGNALGKQGKPDEAVACYRRALELRPNFAEAYSNLGLVLQGRQRLEHALACFRRVLELKPDWAEAHFNVGNVLQDEQKPEEALGFYRRALELDPAHARAHNNLGNAWKDQGNLSGAIASYRRALELQPDYVEAHSNLVYTLLFSPEHEARRIYEETCRWSEKHAEALTKSAGPHTNDRSPSRRLRVGYVSPDFRFHPVGRFLLPLLESHDHQHFEVLAYSSVRVPDAVTEECRRHVDAWRDVLALSDAELADAVRRDRIDILVDLTMHMANGRLLAFARKPAPVQVTYLAYCGTTGLRTIDYRLTDPYLDPPGQDTGIYTERSVHLPETYWCYRAPAAVPPVSPPPVLQTGRTTFGCLNNFCKVSDPALAAWGRILRTTPGSRLLLHSRPGAHRLRVGEFFQREGVAQDRVEFLELLPFEEYCRVHERIDIALDPFPYAGGTTTCDALWMGVPVVSLAGRTAVGRGGLSILSNIGLADMAARDVEEYVGLAIALAGDKDRLEKLRGTMRGRMQNSPLTDAPRFARNVEAAYRVMWQEWIA